MSMLNWVQLAFRIHFNRLPQLMIVMFETVLSLFCFLYMSMYGVRINMPLFTVYYFCITTHCLVQTLNKRDAFLEDMRESSLILHAYSIWSISCDIS